MQLLAHGPFGLVAGYLPPLLGGFPHNSNEGEVPKTRGRATIAAVSIRFTLLPACFLACPTTMPGTAVAA